MRTVAVNCQAPPFSIPLGRQGENLAVQIVFDCTEFAETYGDGRAELLHRQPATGLLYPVAIEQDGSAVTWTITNADTAVSGAGSAELRWYAGDVLAKSVVFRTSVLRALEGTADTEPPEPQQAWVDKVLASMEGLSTNPDCAQSDETAPDYIKNKTHYRYEDTVLVSGGSLENFAPSAGVVYGQDELPSADYVVGDEYTVIVNGVSYTMAVGYQLEDAGGNYYVGFNLAEGSCYVTPIMGGEADFALYGSVGGSPSDGDVVTVALKFAYLESAEYDTPITIQVCRTNVSIKQLDAMYIPDEIARAADVDAKALKIVDLDIVNNTATATGAEIVAHIDAGGIVLGRILDNIFALPICMGNDVFFEWRYPGECDVFYTINLSAESTAITNLPFEVGHVRTMDIVDNLTTDNAKKPLSAAQGVELKRMIDDVTDGTGETASGADKSWELLNTVTLDEDSNSVIINQDSDGEAFEVDAFAFYIDAVSSDLQTTSGTVYVGAAASGYIGQIQNVSATSARVWGCYEFLTERMLRTASGTAASGTPTVSISYTGSYPLSAQMVRIYGYYLGAGSVVYLYGRRKV